MLPAILLNLPVAVRNGIALTRLLRSRTTARQYKYSGLIALPLAILLAAVAMAFPGTWFSDTSFLLNILTILVASVGPLISRITAFAKHPDKMLDTNETAYVCKARRRGDKSWHEFVGTVLDAYEEGQEEVVLWEPNKQYLHTFNIRKNRPGTTGHIISMSEMRHYAGRLGAGNSD